MSKGGSGGAPPNDRDTPIADAWTLLAEVVNELPIAVWMIDARGVFTLSEGGALKAVGLSPGELVGESAFERWSSQPEMLKGVKAALHGDRAFDQRDAGGRSFAGRVAPVRGPDGAITGAVGIALDVTERVEAERALVSAELRFRDLIDGAPDGMLVHDGTTVLYGNAALAVALGYEEPSELVGQPTGTIFLEKDREVLRGRMRHARETGKKNPPLEVELRTKTGATRWFECSSRAIEHGGVPAFLIQARDVEERRAMAARLLQAEQLASLGTLAAGVAHEINNPLTYVLMNLELIRRRTRGDPALVELSRELESATEGVGRVRDIVADLRAFSRRDDGARTLLDVRVVLDSAIRMAWSEIHHRAELERDYRAVSAVEATESRLAQVFLNLLLNAAQSFPEAGPHPHRIYVATRETGGEVIVEIADDGPGMSAETSARAFEPFFTTKPAGVGTGLGLSICRSIVASLGGTIDVESAPGRGSSFRVALPAHAGRPIDDRPRKAPLPVDRPQGRVLVVDDERAIGDGLRRALDGAWLVDVATSAAEALAALSPGCDYDAILCDVMMPETTGIELFERVRTMRPELAARFVFMTGGAFTPQARAFLEVVSAPCLQKPFSVDELSSVLARARAVAPSRG